MTLPKTNVVIKSPAPNMLPIANKMPLSDPEATTAVIKSGDPFASAINVTLNQYFEK